MGVLLVSTEISIAISLIPLTGVRLVPTELGLPDMAAWRSGLPGSADLPIEGDVPGLVRLIG